MLQPIRTLAVLFIHLLLAVPLYAQTVSVSFNVDMSYQQVLGNFDPDQNFVDIAGTFNGWDGSDHLLEDEEGDLVYSINVDGFTPGETIEFKFRIDGEWDGREEFPGGGPNRSYTVQEEDNVVEVWYNDELPPDGPPIADFSISSSSIFENGTVWFTDRSGGFVTEWKWEFEGGTPSTSTDRNPVVTYQNAGSYDVTLIAKHEDEADTLTVENAITVNEWEPGETYWWNDAVFYEIFVRSFFDSDGDGIGDFAGMIEKLDYLNDGDPESGESLGITGIWLMPIHESPSYHGYDVLDYESVNSEYGTMDEFKAFLDAAHERGIKVIIDYVVNHSSSQHQWFLNSQQNLDDYREYYYWRPDHPGYNGPWGQNVWHSSGGEYYYGLFWGGMPDLNFNHEPLKQKIFDSAEFWLTEVGVDGFRLDAVMFIHKDGSQLQHVPETFEFWHEFNNHVKAANPDAVTVGEAWTSTEQVIPYVSDDRIDIAFEFDLAYTMMDVVRQGDARALEAQMQNVYDSYDFLQYATFLTNHDKDRVMSEFNDDSDRARTAAAIYLTLPGVPFIYYGEEIGMTGTKPDPDIRTPMQWTSDTHAGFTTGSPWRSVNSNFTNRNVELMDDDPESLLNWYRTLVHLRNDHISLRRGQYQNIPNSENALYTFQRTYDDERLLVMINTGSQQLELDELFIPGLNIEEGAYSITNLAGGDEMVITVSGAGTIEDLNFDSHHTIVLSMEDANPVSIEEGGEAVETFQLDQNYPNPFNPGTIIPYHLPEQADVTIRVYNILGQQVWVSNKGVVSPGSYTAEFDAGNLSSGVYIYQLVIDGQLQDSRKMMLVK